MTLGIVGDIGATNARFALVGEDGRAVRTRVYAVDDYPSLGDAAAAYLAAEGERPAAAAFAVAGPVTGDTVTLTNHPWSFSIAALKRQLVLERLAVVNDFTANALAVPHLRPDDRAQVGGGSTAAAAPIAVIGPGSGLGVSGLVPVPGGGGWIALAGEGGHATMAPSDERESALIDRMRRRFGHVSAERVLSGPGLVNLYETLCELDGVPALPYTPAQIADRRIGEAEPLCRAALDLFCAMLGSAAGNLALILGARGGVFIAGGIVPKLMPEFAASRFRARFEDKGRFQPYVAAIATFVITCPIPAFLGLASLLRD
jgi:glucokinase